MKNLIKTAAIALATGIMCLNAGGAEPGKELLGRIKANQQVVTQEVDSVFTEWKAGQEISFPNAGTNTFWIGDKTLGQWLAENKGTSQPGISQETDPIFSDWLGTNEYTKVESDPTVPEWAKVENPPYLTNAIVNITTNGVPVEADGDTVNIQIPEQTPPLYVDSTLTTNGAAANAKTVGNELALRANLTRTTVTFGGEDGAGNYRSFTARAGSLVMYDSTRTYLLYENSTGNEPGTVSLCKFGGVINKIATAQGSLADYTLEFDVPDRGDGGFRGFPAGTFTLTRSSKLEFAAYSSNGNVPAKTSDLANDGTNGMPFATVDDVDSATNTLYETMTNEFVRLADIQDGITFDTMNVTNLTINGSAVSTEGHKHDASDITNLVPVTISSISTNGVAITPDGNRNIDIAVPSPVAVVAPSPNAAPGTAADAKTVGDALTSGFTEWEFSGELDNQSVESLEWSDENERWEGVVLDAGTEIVVYPEGGKDATSLSLLETDIDIAAIRHLITPTKTSQLTNDGTNGTPFAVATDLNSYLPLSGGNMDDQAEISAFTFSTQPGDFAWNYQLLTGNGFRMIHTNGLQDISINENGVEFGFYPWDNTSDSYGIGWPTRGGTFALQEDVNDASNNLVNAISRSLLGKIDVTNGIARGSLTVYSKGSGAMLLGGNGSIITTIWNDYISINHSTTEGRTEYRIDGISRVRPQGEETYGFDTTTNGIARLKDVDSATNSLYQAMTNEFVKLSDLESGITFDTISVTNITINGKAVSTVDHVHSTNDITDLMFPAETDPLFMAVFGNPILNLIPYDEINLTGTNVIKIKANSIDISGPLQGGTNSTASGSNSFAFGNGAMAIGENAYAVGQGTMAGSFGWYYTHVNFETGTFYLSREQPDITSTPTNQSTAVYDSEFQSGLNVGDVISYVNKNKIDMCATIQSIDGNKVVVGQLQDQFRTITEAHPNHDDWTIFSPSNVLAGQVWLGECSFAEGKDTRAINAYSHAEGRETVAYGQYSHAEGKVTEAGYAAHTEGEQTKAKGARSHAEGYDTVASGSSSHAEGQHTRAAGQATHIEGHSATAVTDATVNKNADGIIADWEQQKFSLAKGTAAHVEGKDNLGLGEYSHAEGLQTTALGPRAHAEGSGTFANGNNAHAEGGGTQATMENSHAEGSGTIASGNRSHAEGSGSEASQNNAHAEGMSTKACSNSAHAEGASTVAGNGTRPSANTSTAEGNFAHAEGNGTFAKGNSSHAEGKSTQALKPYSHAEGLSTTADGNKSHAEGWQTTAAGEDSHAEGGNTQTSNRYEHAQGSYNKSNKGGTDFGNAGNTIHSIGIGTSTQRKNAVEVMQNGDVYIKGVGGYNGTNPNATGVTTLQAKIQSLETASSGVIKNITTNGTAFSVSGDTVTIPLDNYVRIDELSKGLKFNNMNVTNLTINGRQPSLVGHTHTVSEIDDLQGLWSIPGAETAATNAIAQIQAAQNDTEVKAALIQFLNNFKKPTQ